MSEFTVTCRIDAPVETIWEVLDDFGEIARWSPGVKRSALTSEGSVGVGTTRHCDFSPLGGVNERIDRYLPNERMTVHLYDLFKMPVSSAIADFKLAAHENASVLTLDVSYTPNRLGRLAKGMTDKQMRKGMNSLAEDLKREAERITALEELGVTHATP